jgi:2'-5' RNA ligase
MAEINQYTLWVVPPGEVYEKLAALILQLSRRYNAPKFEPHLTLLGDIEATEEGMLEKSQQLAESLNPFRVHLAKVGQLDDFFRCVFLRAEETPALMAANAEVRKMFGRQADPGFMPHVSLLYGHYPAEIKEKAIAQIGGGFDIEFDVNSIHLVYSSANIPINDWNVIKEFPLSKSKT